MSDLSEALEWWDDNKGFLWQRIPNEEWAHIDRGLAAARNWHTLTNPTDELIDRVAQILADQDTVLVEDAPEIYLPLARAVVDALTVTAEPEEEE